ncbi:MAG: NYN domain-containing protein [Verrucomicrobiaceae bacterium]|nr:NYN domain-containing protein [Verrucomicrobiaceae bacterium]
MERVITYIDGFNLYFGLRQKRWQRYYWLDVLALSRALLKPTQQLEMVRYFTSRVTEKPSDPGQPRRQHIYLEALETLPQTTLHFGHYLSKPATCKSCGAQYTKYEEKMTDVNIAMELLTDAHQDAFDTAIVISGDSDLTGPVLKIRDLFPTKKVIVAFPPERSSDQLKRAAHGHFIIGRANLAASQLPDPVSSKTGFPLKRPSSWA